MLSLVPILSVFLGIVCVVLMIILLSKYKTSDSILQQINFEND